MSPAEDSKHNGTPSVSEIAQTVADVVLGRELTAADLAAVQATVVGRIANQTTGVRLRMSDTFEQRAEKLTPPLLAAQWGVSPDKILSWIRSGELRAINAATSSVGRPRYLIDPQDVAAFENRRMVRANEQIQRRRKRQRLDIKEYF